MRALTGQNPDSTKPLTQSQTDLLYLIESHGAKELSDSLKKIHDLALYYSDVPFEKAEKSALFDLKVLAEGFERLAAG